MTTAEATFGRQDRFASASPANDIPSLQRARPHPIILLYLLCVVIPIAFQAGPMFMTTLRLITLALVIPLTINLLRGKYGPIILTDILFFAHLGWIAVALWVNNPDRVVEQVGSVGVEFLGGYMIGRAYIRTPEAFAALCRVLIVMVLAAIPFAIYETQTGRPIIVEYIRRIPGLTSVAIVTIEERMGLERVQSTFAHPIHFALFCSVAFSLTFVALQGLINDAKRYTATVLILCTGLLGLSSGALLAMVMQIGLISWYMMFRQQPNRWWILVGVTTFCYVVVDLISTRSAYEVFLSRATFSSHNAYWRMIIFEWGLANVIGSAEKGIEGNPLFGIGMNDWIRPHFMHSGSMDNFWLVMGVRYGLPGFLTLAIGYLLLIARVMRRDFSGSLMLTQFRRAWVFTFLGLSFTLSTVHVWGSIYSFVTFMFGAGVWFITAQVSDAPETAAEASAERPRGPVFTRFDRSVKRGGSSPLAHSRGALPLSANRGTNRSS